jgi:hypothetical protein
VRALCYIVSSLFFGVGFLWSLFDAEKRAWHDKLTGTMVLETRPKTGFATAGIIAAALLFATAGAALIIWPLAAPYYAQMEIMANARESLAALARFEDIHKARAGVYTSDVNELGKAYGNPQEFVTLLAQTIDLRTLRIEADEDHYVIQAKALDANSTPFEITGPH